MREKIMQLSATSLRIRKALRLSGRCIMIPLMRNMPRSKLQELEKP